MIDLCAKLLDAFTLHGIQAKMICLAYIDEQRPPYEFVVTYWSLKYAALVAVCTIARDFLILFVCECHCEQNIPPVSIFRFQTSSQRNSLLPR